MPGKRKKAQQYRLYMRYRNMGDTQEKAAAKADFSLSTAKRLEVRGGILETKRQYKTRPDPFGEVWESELLSLLQKTPTLSAAILLEYLQDKYPKKYSDKLIRTLQRRVRKWKALNGPEKEIMFTQEHLPGLLGLSDFTHLKGMTIKINGESLKHILYHFRLAYSGWSYVRIIQGGESFTALAESLQNALWRLGGSPKEHRTDSLSAAFKNLSKDAKEDLTKRYSALCSHYGIKPTRNNLGCKHENGSIESSHRHMKRRIREALALRGNGDFSSIQEYQSFIDTIVTKHNQKNYESIKYERTFLLDLPLLKTCDYTETIVAVASTSTIRVKNTIYSVPSRLIGENLRVHIYDDRLECYLGAEHLFQLPKYNNEHREVKKHINYRHLLGSLIKKPGAFGRSTIKYDILPTQDFIDIWNYLEARCERQQACKIIVGILQLCVETDQEQEIASYVKEIIIAKKIPYLELLRKHFKPSKSMEQFLELKVEQHDLKAYNSLLITEGVNYASGC